MIVLLNLHHDFISTLESWYCYAIISVRCLVLAILPLEELIKFQTGIYHGWERWLIKVIICIGKWNSLFLEASGRPCCRHLRPSPPVASHRRTPHQAPRSRRYPKYYHYWQAPISYAPISSHRDGVADGTPQRGVQGPAREFRRGNSSESGCVQDNTRLSQPRSSTGMAPARQPAVGQGLALHSETASAALDRSYYV